ncbi:MAG: 5-formyltetrahydrofolate cyclo-ligase [Bacteroidales bacterium]
MIDAKKNHIRKAIKLLKSAISIEEKNKRSAIIFEKLEENKTFQNAACIMLYWSMDDEVQTHDFVIKWAKNKEIILPSVQNDILVLRKFNGIQSLKTGEKYGIQEPEGDDFTDFEKIELVIIPGIAFDSQNNRMGRGKAYYDKLLKQMKAKKIAVCFKFQMIDNVPTDEHDVKMDEIITD